jgi:hypothetical protein
VVFSSLLACLEGGRFDADLTQSMRAMVDQLRRRHREGGGRPTGKISIQVHFAWEDDTVSTKQSFTVDPSVTRSPDRFFVKPGGALTQHAPQETIPLEGADR